MTSEDCLLRVDHASCRINRRSQLRVAHFSVRQGEHWCLFGGNGSGKTLLANLIAGKRLESGSYVTYREGLEPGRDIVLVSFEEQQRLWQRDNRLDMSEYSDRAEDPGTTVSQLLRPALLPVTVCLMRMTQSLSSWISTSCCSKASGFCHRARSGER